jgi:hypothetical protein
MRRIARTVALSLAGLLTLSAAAGTAHAQYTAYALRPAPGAGGGQQLVRYNTADPSMVTVVGSTTRAETILALDFRPATGMLYGFNGSSIFTFDLTTGAAAPVAATSSTTDLFSVGFDFNPTVDRIRIVDGANRNLRVNPVDGATIVDGPYVYAAGDSLAGSAPRLSAVAYTNNVPGATTTTLYGLDRVRGTLVRIASPNGGAVNTVGSLGLNFLAADLDFDIVTVGGTDFGFFTATTLTVGPTALYRVNLDTGAATLVGTVAGGGLRGFAIAPATTVIPEPATVALTGLGLVVLAGIGRRRARRASA